MPDSAVGPVIVRYIEELEAAIKYAHEVMQPTLGKAVAEIIEHRKNKFDWGGEIESELDAKTDSWLAPREWQIANDTENNQELYVAFGSSIGIDGVDPGTWVGNFSGFSGAGIRFYLYTKSLNSNSWKKLLSSEVKIIDDLVAKGFKCDLNTRNLSMPISIKRDALAEAFAEDNFEEALKPIATALDNIESARDTLDQLVAAIRKASR